jgi:ribosomal-protein-alanine N-acetyltransferase
MHKKIETENLILHACDRETLKQAISGNQHLAKHLHVVVPDLWTEFGSRALKYALEKLNFGESEQGWWTYLPIHKNDNKLIGSCGYKGKPNTDGIVEISYEISSAYRNRGLGTELAKALVAHAFVSADVNSVQAHTLGEVNASNKILTKCGFQKMEEINEQGNGLLWKWEIKNKINHGRYSLSKDHK